MIGLCGRQDTREQEGVAAWGGLAIAAARIEDEEYSDPEGKGGIEFHM